MDAVQYYVLFENHDNGMRLYKSLKGEGIKCTIAPTPRQVSKCCGISLMVNEEDIPRIRECVQREQIEILDIKGVARSFNPRRDKYC